MTWDITSSRAFTIAMTALATTRRSFPSLPLPDSAQYGLGICGGPSVMEPYRALPPALIAPAFTAWAVLMDAPNASRVGQAMSLLVQHSYTPDRQAIDREWDGQLATLHATRLLPGIQAWTQREADRRVFWRQAAQYAATWFGGVDTTVAWVVVRWMDGELEGLSPNPFAPYLGL